MESIEDMPYVDHDGRLFIDDLGAAHNEIDGDLGFLSERVRHRARTAEKAKENVGGERTTNNLNLTISHYNFITINHPDAFFEE